jgi:DNA-binding transcriptional MerR regulator
MNDVATFTLEELSRQVQARLESLGLLDAQRDGRVAPAPDARTVRYYGTLGLLDRPRIVDREARYGPRHVLQLVAIKALQALGMPLGDVQQNLYARSNSELESLLNTVTIDRSAKGPAVQPVRWHEVVLEPGVKLMVKDGWSPSMSPAALDERIRAALAALAADGGWTS